MGGECPGRPTGRVGGFSLGVWKTRCQASPADQRGLGRLHGEVGLGVGFPGRGRGSRSPEGGGIGERARVRDRRG